MPDDDTQDDLLDHVTRLSHAATQAAHAESATFHRAVDTLDEIAGGRRAHRFQDEVARVLRSIPDAVVAAEPQSARTSIRPDFLVSLGGRTFLIDVAETLYGTTSAAVALSRATNAFNADEALVVVPSLVIPIEDIHTGEPVKTLPLKNLVDYLVTRVSGPAGRTDPFST